ncbi:MAG: TFIIB-type zinc ribbon-containing protein [Phycisphaerales bacterium]
MTQHTRSRVRHHGYPPGWRLFRVGASLAGLGLVASWMVAVGIAFTVDPRARQVQSGSEYLGGPGVLHRFDVWQGRGFALADVAWTLGAKRRWSPEQATGAPDTPLLDDEPTAWASAGQDDGPEWLEVALDDPIRCQRIRVHQSFNPGAAVRVIARATLAGKDGGVVIWTGAPTPDPTPIGDPSVVLEVPVDPPMQIASVRIELDSAAVRGWNEIDAVEFIAEDGTAHPATSASASSMFGQPGGLTASELPAWSRLELSAPLATDAPMETVTVAAFGWPMRAWVARSARQRHASANPGGANVVRTPSGPIEILPLRPIVGPALVNSVFFGVAIGIVGAVVLVPLRVFRRLARMQTGRCPRCGYDIRYDFARGCPECGLLRKDARNKGETPVAGA